MPTKRYELEISKSEEWILGPVLGQGLNGTVHLAAPRDPRAPRFKAFPAFVAVKSSSSIFGRADLERERSLLQQLSDCPNVIRYLGDEEITSEKNGLVSLHLFLEFAYGGTLARLIDEAWPEPVDIRIAIRHTRSVLAGLKRIHELGIVHCDVKPENILLVQENEKDDSELGFVAKLADFGMAKRADQRLSLKGTMIYMPPEAARVCEQDQASDVWALGCVVLQMFGGKLPWGVGNLTRNEIRRKIMTRRPVLPPGLSNEARDFLEKCFVENPKDRATAGELLSHPFLREPATEKDSVSFMIVPTDFSDHSLKPTVLGSENVTVSDESQEQIQTSCSSSGRAIREFGAKSLSKLQYLFRRLFY